MLQIENLTISLRVFKLLVYYLQFLTSFNANSKYQAPRNLKRKNLVVMNIWINDKLEGIEEKGRGDCYFFLLLYFLFLVHRKRSEDRDYMSGKDIVIISHALVRISDFCGTDLEKPRMNHKPLDCSGKIWNYLYSLLSCPGKIANWFSIRSKALRIYAGDYFIPHKKPRGSLHHD